jgi:predicted glycoside hydrolase/deacetylase ChbG (UPF0249 family)
VTDGVVVNADDLGVSPGATLGVLEAHNNGCVTSASLLVTTPYYRQAVDTCVKTCPALGIGLHFSLTLGRPASPPERVPLLIDATGRFRWTFTSLFRALAGRGDAALAAQIEIELEAQLARLHADGIRPDHINGERHVHRCPGVLEQVVAAAERHDVPFVRAGADIGTRFTRVEHLAALVMNGGFVKSWLLSRLAQKSRVGLGRTVRTPDRVASYLYTGRMDLILEELLFASADSGVTEVVVHPGIPEESRGVDLGDREVNRYLASEDRRRELNACLAARSARGSIPLTTFARLAAGASA